MTIAESAQVAYVDFHLRLRELAADLANAGERDRASVIRQRAFLAYVAARAEKKNPEPRRTRWLER